ncbi:hypothetical protein RIF29_20964 [Crotalaria pallida]|uniref:Uncharacterized protein n=1 Tax=Crotalaria pallida TaxID=3830 RepID=A0AAN9I5J0_CROPI
MADTGHWHKFIQVTIDNILCLPRPVSYVISLSPPNTLPDVGFHLETAHTPTPTPTSQLSVISVMSSWVPP